jgi:MFS family permease
MSSLRGLQPVAAILVGATLMLSLAMGLRQSLGIFMPALTRDLGISVSEFTMAVAVQNLTWGVLQPFTGAAVVRFGYRRVMLLGCASYAASMWTLATATSFVGGLLGAGFGVGMAVSCTGNALALAITARTVPGDLRSQVMGMVSAGGSLGALVAAPVGQVLAQDLGWRAGIFGFMVLAMLMLPAAWVASRVDFHSQPLPPQGDAQSARAVLNLALSRPAFVVMALAYFVCGMQLVFLTTHLPS